MWVRGCRAATQQQDERQQTIAQCALRAEPSQRHSQMCVSASLRLKERDCVYVNKKHGCLRLGPQLWSV